MLLSHSLVQSSRAPGHIHNCYHSDSCTAWDKESRATLLKRCSIPFPCNHRANNNKPMCQWVDQIGELGKIPLLCSSSLYGKKGIVQLPKKKKIQRSKRVSTTAYREKRIRLLSRVVTKQLWAAPRAKPTGWQMPPATARQPPTEIKVCGRTTSSMRDWTDKHLKFKWVSGKTNNNNWKKYRQIWEKNWINKIIFKKMSKRTEAWTTTKSTWKRRDGLAFGKSRCTYLLRKDNSQNHGNKQTNEEEKETKKIKLNDK